MSGRATPGLLGTRLSRLGTAVADLTLGRACAGCDRPGVHLCAQCRRELSPQPRLHARLPFEEVAAGVSIPIFTGLAYTGVRRHVIYRFKDHGDHSVLPELAAALRVALGMTPLPSIAVPIPSRQRAARARGFTPITRVLATAGRTLPITTREVLRDTRTTRADKGLGASDRKSAVAGAFTLLVPPPKHPVVIVDDVVTTGATLREAAATLMFAGVHVVAGAAIAGTPGGQPG